MKDKKFARSLGFGTLIGGILADESVKSSNIQ